MTLDALPATSRFPDAAATVRLARKRLAQARWSHRGLVAGVLAGLVFGPALGLDVLAYAAIVAGALWVLLAVRSARLSQVARSAWAAASRAGEAKDDTENTLLDAAEARAREVLSGFCLLRPVTIAAVQALAAAAHRRGRFDDAARLAGFVLGRPEKPLVGDGPGTRLLLADALLSAGQAAAATRELDVLGQAGGLSLGQSLTLLSLYLRADAAAENFGRMTTNLPATLAMLEVMPGFESARCHALLLLAAERRGLDRWPAFLRRRVELLADPADLVKREPLAAEVLA